MTAVEVLLPQRTVHVSGAGYAPEGGFRIGDEPRDPQAQANLLELCRCALLCNDAALRRDQSGEWELVGDPTEGALVALALKAGLDASAERERLPRVDEIPFESERC